MKTSIRNPRAEKIFRNKEAIELYNSYASHPDICQHGIDSKGHIYFQYLNGNIESYTRRNFLKLSLEIHERQKDM